MILSESWLREWVNPDLDSDGLAHRLTMAGLEVDAVGFEVGLRRLDAAYHVIDLRQGWRLLDLALLGLGRLHRLVAGFLLAWLRVSAR